MTIVNKVLRVTVQEKEFSCLIYFTVMSSFQQLISHIPEGDVDRHSQPVMNSVHLTMYRERGIRERILLVP